MDKPKIEEPTALSRPRWIVLVTVVLSMLAVGLGAFAYTGYVDGQREKAERRARAELAAQEREADQRWCALLTTLDDAYSTIPPTSELGRKVANAIHALRTDLNC